METTRLIWSAYQSFQHYLRARQIRHDNAQLSTNPSESLMVLPDDILFMILDVLYDGSRSRERDRGLSADFAFRQDFLNLSMTNKRIRTLFAPKLFRSISLGTSRSPDYIYKALEPMRKCEAVATYTRTMKLDLWVDDKYQRKKEKGLAKSFMHFLLTSPQLEKLIISMPPNSATTFQTVCESTNIVLPNNAELVLSPGMEWFMSSCPNVRSISSNDWSFRHAQQKDFVDRAGALPHLTHFDMQAMWDVELLQVVLRCMPQLQSLGMRGFHYAQNIHDMLPVLQQFQHLERLQLMDAQKLLRMPGSYYNDLRFSGHFPRDLVGPTRARNAISRVVFEALPELKELNLGRRFKAKVVRSSTQRIDINWESIDIVPCTQGFGRRGRHPLDEEIEQLMAELEDEILIDGY